MRAHSQAQYIGQNETAATRQVRLKYAKGLLNLNTLILLLIFLVLQSAYQIKPFKVHTEHT